MMTSSLFPVLLSYPKLIEKVVNQLRPNYIYGDILNDINSKSNDDDALVVLKIFNDFVNSALIKAKDHCISFSSDSNNVKTLIFFLNEYSYINDISINNENGDIIDHTLAFLLIRTQCFSDFITKKMTF